MSQLLYLDTARMGLMSPAAQSVVQDFSRFVGEVGASHCFDEFLWHGIATCPQTLARKYPALASWGGVGALKESLCNLTTLPAHSKVLLAGRSLQLMKFAATLLCRPCRNILVTDNGWPPYRQVLEAECRRTGRRTTTVSLGGDLLANSVDSHDVVERIHAAYLKHRCDGLLLTAVSHLGLRLPIQKIVRRIEQSAEVWFVVVDGAQDFCHVDSNLEGDCADLYLAGSHKWLKGYHPLGLAFYGKRRSRHVVETVLRDSLDALHIDDPLLRFLEEGKHKGQLGADETVNLSGLFACQGAVNDAALHQDNKSQVLSYRFENSRRVAAIAEEQGWVPETPHPSLQSGILVLRARDERVRSLPAEALRGRFHQHGVALTGYEQGRVRLSMPGDRLQEDELCAVRKSLEEVA